MLFKTHGENKSIFLYPAMFMKTLCLEFYTCDVDENNGGCAPETVLGLLARPRQSSMGVRQAQVSVAPLLVGGIRNSPRVAAEGNKTDGGSDRIKDVKKEGRSGNVYENKGQYDTLPHTKSDISAWLHAILQKSALIFAETAGFLVNLRVLGNESSHELKTPGESLTL
jgi:hypothetical protein